MQPLIHRHRYGARIRRGKSWSRSAGRAGPDRSNVAMRRSSGAPPPMWHRSACQPESLPAYLVGQYRPAWPPSPLAVAAGSDSPMAVSTVDRAVPRLPHLSGRLLSLSCGDDTCRRARRCIRQRSTYGSDEFLRHLNLLSRQAAGFAAQTPDPGLGAGRWPNRADLTAGTSVLAVLTALAPASGRYNQGLSVRRARAVRAELIEAVCRGPIHRASAIRVCWCRRVLASANRRTAASRSSSANFPPTTDRGAAV